MEWKQKTQQLLVIIVFCIVIYNPVFAKKITLATAEHEPYIGVKLPNKGYVYELVSAIYKRVGYKVNIHFYPLARAQFLTINGLVDGYIPAHINKHRQQSLIFSDPFPGDNIGLLKKKTWQAPNIDPVADSLDTQLSLLKNYQFGIVRGADVTPLFDQASYLQKQFVVNNIQNLDKLMEDRIDFVVGDRYTLADTMALQRPHLIGQLEFLPSPHFSNAFHIAFSKKTNNYRQLKDDFNRGLKLLSQDGTLESLLTKHGFFPNKLHKKDAVVLTIGTVNNKDMLVMQGLSNEFEKAHPDIKLQWRVLAETTLRKRLLSDLAISDGQFDIMTIGSYETPIWAERGWLMPIDNLPKDYEVNDLLPSVRNLLTYQKKLYGLPFYSESSMMFYRKDLFNQHNLAMPTQPTYDDIIKFAATIHNPDQEVYGMCIRGKAGWGENIAALSSIINTYGGDWFDQKWRPLMDSSAWRKSLAIYIKLITQYAPPLAHNNGFNENLGLFSNGHCAMWIDSTVAASLLFDAKYSKVFDKTEYTSAPVGSVTEGAHWLWSWALAIPDSSKHKKEALEFITWATSKNYTKHVAAQRGWIAAPAGTRISTYENELYLQSAPFAEFVLENINDGKPLGSTQRTASAGSKNYVSIPDFHSIGDYVGSLLVKVIQGKMSQAQALEKSQKFAEKKLQDSEYYKN